MQKKVVILGLGISGLSSAWYLSKFYPSFECICLEKSPQVGGWMGSSCQGDFVLEKGPRIFSASRSQAFLELIKELDFLKKIIPSRKEAEKRFIRMGGKFHKVPNGPFSFLSCGAAVPVPAESSGEPVFTPPRIRGGCLCRRRLADAARAGSGIRRRVGEYHSPQVISSSAPSGTSTTLVQNTIRMYPFIPSSSITIDASGASAVGRSSRDKISPSAPDASTRPCSSSTK